MRLIDADAVITQDWFVEYIGNLEETQVKDIIQQCKWYVMKAPHIDIVRCSECRYCKKKRGTFKGEPIIFYRCTENNRDVESDDYCSWGEREGE